MQRLTTLQNQLSSATPLQQLTSKNSDDVVIIAAHRTAIARGKKGSFKDSTSAEILSQLLKTQIKKINLDPTLIDSLVVGNVCNPGAGVNEHRAAQLVADIPYTTPFMAVNRQCSSGLMAVNQIANEIKANQIDLGIGAGVESMSTMYGPNMMDGFPERFTEDDKAVKCLIPMGITSENVAMKYEITRLEQDQFAANSFKKAEHASLNGLFKDEILPIEVVLNDKKVLVSKDEGIRPNVTPESLAKLRPAFDENGTTTAGNSSQVSDGAGSVVLARRSVAQKLGLPIIGKFVHCKTVGVPPELMGIGPAVAIPAVLKDLNLSVDDVDVFEINEAFASQALYSIKSANIDITKVNPKGGAIALGHPLGATGARQIATLLTELKRTGKKVGVTSMCIGTGMGAASVIVRE